MQPNGKIEELSSIDFQLLYMVAKLHNDFITQSSLSTDRFQFGSATNCFGNIFERLYSLSPEEMGVEEIHVDSAITSSGYNRVLPKLRLPKHRTIIVP